MHIDIISSSKALIIVALATACSARSGEVQETGPPDAKVKTKAISSRQTDAALSLSGSLEADKITPLSFQVPGRVVRVWVEEGDYVKQGALLASLEVDDYQNNLAIAEAQWAEAKDAFQRLKQLYEQESLPEKRFIEAQSGYQQAEAGLALAKKKYADTRLYAPQAGTVAQRSVEEGQIVDVGVPVLVIAATRKLYARVSVPESEIGRISVGSEATVTIPTLGDTTVVGQLTIVSPVADPTTRSYTAKVALDNPNLTLRDGMVAEVDLSTAQQQSIITVPGGVISRDGNNVPYVFRVDTDTNKAIKQRVTVGSLYDQEVIIEEGLKAGDEIVVSGQHKLRDGQSISVVN